MSAWLADQQPNPTIDELSRSDGQPTDAYAFTDPLLPGVEVYVDDDPICPGHGHDWPPLASKAHYTPPQPWDKAGRICIRPQHVYNKDGLYSVVLLHEYAHHLTGEVDDPHGEEWHEKCRELGPRVATHATKQRQDIARGAVWTREDEAYLTDEQRQRLGV